MVPISDAGSGTGNENQNDGNDATDEDGATGASVPAPDAGKLYFGVFPGDETPDGLEDEVSPELVESFEQAVGKQVTWVYFSHNWYRGHEFPADTASWIRNTGAVPFIRLMLRNDGEQDHADPIYNLTAILSGEFDVDLEAWGAAAAEFGTPLLVEWGTEFNGEWFSWNGVWNGGGESDGFGDPNTPDGPERFVATYQHIVDIIRGTGAGNITWVFHVNAPDVPDEDWNRFENYYPGDDYVDWLGISIYGAGTPMDTGVESFREQLDAEYARMTTMAPEKPVIIAEMASAANNVEISPEDWTEAALTDLFNGRWQRVIGFAWWNESWPNDDNPANDTNLRVQDTPNLAALFRNQLEQSSGKLQERVSFE
ncbi:MAG: glycoside hydrolase family 26 protein [Planctomycetota bacterium]|jgi:hypothetical protein